MPLSSAEASSAPPGGRQRWGSDGTQLLLPSASGVRQQELMSVPAILGALVLKLSAGISLATMPWAPALIGFGCAVVVGYGALVLLVALVRRGQLHRFAAYLVPLAASYYLLLA